MEDSLSRGKSLISGVPWCLGRHTLCCCSLAVGEIPMLWAFLVLLPLSVSLLVIAFTKVWCHFSDRSWVSTLPGAFYRWRWVNLKLWYNGQMIPGREHWEGRLVFVRVVKRELIRICAVYWGKDHKGRDPNSSLTRLQLSLQIITLLRSDLSRNDCFILVGFIDTPLWDVQWALAGLVNLLPCSLSVKVACGSPAMLSVCLWKML